MKTIICSVLVLLGMGISTSFANSDAPASPGAAPIYCIPPVIEGVQVYESHGRIFVEFDIFPLQRTHVWDDLYTAERDGYVEVNVAGIDIPAHHVQLRKALTQSWQFIQARIDITDYFYPGSRITVSAFHKSDGRQKCYGEKSIFAPFSFWRSGRYSSPSGPLLPTRY